MGTVALGAFGFGVHARAVAGAPGKMGALVGDQAEWAQQYDSVPKLAIQRSTVPLLSQATIDATQNAIANYQDIQAKGGWQKLSLHRQLSLGSRGEDVVALRRRLMVTGDLDRVAGLSPVFDSFVNAGVRRFQARSGLATTGIVGHDTLATLNVPVELRIQQLTLNLVRLRAFAGNLGDRYVMANIPAAQIETVENGVVITHHKAGVGRANRPSPIMQVKATQINFNPFWTVPASIVRKDLIPMMQKESDYLSRNHIRIFDKAGQEVPSSQINWASYDATKYRFRQDPGDGVNALGVVRINIPNPYGVYMHDTDEKGVFGDDYRYVSSGCIRLQDVRDYVAWLLEKNPGWDRARIDDTINSGQHINVDITPPVPVYWEYITAWGSPDGVVQFRQDIYKRDGLNVDETMSPSDLAKEEMQLQKQQVVNAVQQQ
ncbi:MAG: L,D-transpeptidase family protein [Hyphomicrobiales bacterium]|nr:L,D-transpeptidase family protein [Hyphomicrobiales bacterium]MDE2114562.1 L,D-transpeptidase family protein [Hyphomicrobiales bacterium]